MSDNAGAQHGSPQGPALSAGLIALLEKYEQELEAERAAHRDALALLEVYEAKIANLEAHVAAPEALHYILWRYGQDHTGEDHQERLKVVAAWLETL